MHAARGDSLAPQNVARRACDNASGIWDVHHVVNANAVYELPFGAGKSYLNQPGILRSVFGSWQLTRLWARTRAFPSTSPCTRSASAVPDGNTNNQRPNLVPGVSLTPPGGATPSDWINLGGLCGARRRHVRRCATRCGPSPGSVASGFGREQTHCPFTNAISSNSGPKRSTFSIGRSSEPPTGISPTGRESLASSPNRSTPLPSGPGRRGRSSWRFDSNSDSRRQARRAEEGPEGRPAACI